MNKCLSSTRPAALNHKTIKYKRKKKSSSVVWWLLRTAEFHYPNYHYIYRSLSKTQVVFRKHNLDFIIGILRFPFDFRLLSIFRSVFTVFFLNGKNSSKIMILMLTECWFPRYRNRRLVHHEGKSFACITCACFSIRDRYVGVQDLNRLCLFLFSSSLSELCIYIQSLRNYKIYRSVRKIGRLRIRKNEL